MKTVFDISIDFSKSYGSYLFDKKTKSYFLDLFSMFSSLPLGYNHAIFDQSFDNKIKSIAHLRMSNNLFQSDELESFRNSFSRISYHDNLHFCSTGALAVESALKCAFEYKKNKNLLICGVKGGFHGINSWGFVTDDEMFSVKNRVNNFPRNNWNHYSLDQLIDILCSDYKNIAAVIVEAIQCTNSDNYLNISKLQTIQKLCKKNDICFIVDEVQTGFGVTGDFWYSDIVGLKPDVVIFGKKSQICGIMTSQKYSEAIDSDYRKLEVTFDGELIDAVRAEFIMKAISENNLLKNVKEKSQIFKNELGTVFKNYRSAGFLIAFDFPSMIERDSFVKKLYSNNVLVNPTGEKSVRLRPNLALNNSELDHLISEMKK